jgi:hypothetical protein
MLPLLLRMFSIRSCLQLGRISSPPSTCKQPRSPNSERHLSSNVFHCTPPLRPQSLTRPTSRQQRNNRICGWRGSARAGVARHCWRHDVPRVRAHARLVVRPKFRNLSLALRRNFFAVNTLIVFLCI